MPLQQQDNKTVSGCRTCKWLLQAIQRAVTRRRGQRPSPQLERAQITQVISPQLEGVVAALCPHGRVHPLSLDLGELQRAARHRRQQRQRVLQAPCSGVKLAQSPKGQSKKASDIQADQQASRRAGSKG